MSEYPYRDKPGLLEAMDDTPFFAAALEEWRSRVAPRDETPVEEMSGHDFLKVCERAQTLKMEGRPDRRKLDFVPMVERRVAK